VVLAFLITAAVWRYRSSHPYLLVGWGWYLLMLAPNSGVVQSGAQAMADRFTYIPAMGLFMAIVWLVADVKAISRTVATAAAVLAIVIWSIASFRYTGVWRDTLTLFGHAADVVPDNAMAHVIIGNALMAENRPVEANAELAEAVRASHGAPLPLAAAGAALVEQKHYAEAVDPLQRAAEAHPRPARVP